jgi:hypothetical protein
VYNGTAPGTGRIDINMTLIATFATPITTTKLRWSRIDPGSCTSVWEWYIYNIKFGTVTGKVLDDAGKPIAGATATAGAVSSITGADGVYTLVVDPGTVDVKVTDDPTYKSRTARGIVVGDSATVNRDVTLFKNPTDLAAGGDYIASTEDTNTVDDNGDLVYDGTKLVDGDLKTYWQSSEGEGVMFGVQTAKPITFNQVLIYERGNIINNLTLQKYDDAKGDWVDLQTKSFVTGNGDPVLTFTFDQPVTADQIQAVVPEGGITISSAFSTVSAYEFVVQDAPLGTLNVTVQDYVTKKPIPNASVVTDDGSTLGVTNANGVLSLPVDANDYLLTATATGYFEGPGVIATVDSGATASVTISLPPKGDNLVLKATAEADSDDGTDTADMANDGDFDTYWAGAQFPAMITFTWPTAVTFNRVVIDEFGDRSREIDIQVYDDAKGDFVDVGQAVSPGGGANTEIEHVVDLKSPATTKQLRISAPTGATAPQYREVQAFSFTPVPSTPATPSVKLGDLNGDGKISVADATLSLRIAVGLLTATDDQKAADDVNKDGKWTVGDTTLILQVAVGVKSGF